MQRLGDFAGVVVAYTWGFVKLILWDLPVLIIHGCEIVIHSRWRAWQIGRGKPPTQAEVKNCRRMLEEQCERLEGELARFEKQRLDR